MKIQDAIFGTVDKVNDFLGKILWVGVLLSFIVILLEVAMRYFFNSPSVWRNELSQYIFATYAVLCGGLLLRHKKHVNVDILYTRFSPKGKIIAKIVTFPIFLMFTGALLILGTSFVWESFSRFEHSQSAWNPPIFPVKMLIPIAAFLLLAQGIVELIRDIQKYRSGVHDETDENIEAKGQNDEH